MRASCFARTYPPRICGIRTFSRDLREALLGVDGVWAVGPRGDRGIAPADGPDAAHRPLTADGPPDAALCDLATLVCVFTETAAGMPSIAAICRCTRSRRPGFGGGARPAHGCARKSVRMHEHMFV